jgi:hypothetical protein
MDYAATTTPTSSPGLRQRDASAAIEWRYQVLGFTS